MKSNKNSSKFINFDDFYESLPENRKLRIEIGVIRLDLAAKLRNMRRIKNLSSQELSKLSGVSYKTISKIENAKPVKFDTVVRVMQPLGLTVTFSLE